MFVQIMRGKVADEGAIWKAMDHWEAELRPGAKGFLGSTGGVTKDGELVMMARFESEDAARKNSDRPEQGAWFSEVEKGFAGPVTFLESADVDELMGGGSNDAGFVQVMRGRGDREKARSFAKEAEGILKKERPDLLGGITAWHADGTFTDVAYFRSEAEARAGETKEMSDEARALFEQFMSVQPVDEYLDLPQPRFL